MMLPAKVSIIRCRFGIGCEMLTLQQIVDNLSLTRERIRQLETQALRQLHRCLLKCYGMSLQDINEQLSIENI